MGVDTTADVDRFEEALRWFLDRRLMTRAEVDELTAWSRHRSWWITGITKLRLLQDVRDEIDRSMARGDTLEEFKKGMHGKLLSEWTLGEKATSARLEVIYRNASISAYNRGRYEQMTDPDVLDLRPWWMFDAILDSRTSGICRPLDGTIKRSDDPWWDERTPPLHHQCRSGITTLDDYERRELLASSEKRKDGQPVYREKPADDPDAEPPQEGFGYRPTEDDEARYEAELELANFDSDLVREFRREQG